MSTAASAQIATVGKSVSIKGELSGREDLFLDGRLEGSIQLSESSLTIGPNGNVRANISAKDVTVAGTLDGNIAAGGRTEIRKTAVVNGDVRTRRIAIEEGAYFKGKLEIFGEQAAVTGAAADSSAADAKARGLRT
ncbi:MAG: polymer-forming cytoskeletal protein [Acidobacteria bacterium]|nr:polymer-forming cytoskeletal protein [Acidobacteriota bacterium]